jgi:vacuolar protein sorting-associated protein VTA1
VLIQGNTWAVQHAISIGLKDTEAKLFLASLLDQLETTKSQMSAVDAITDEVVGKAYMENFAGNIFGKADDEERGRRATRNTATKFLAASQFMEVLRCFGELDKEVWILISCLKWVCQGVWGRGDGHCGGNCGRRVVALWFWRATADCG